MRWLGSVLGPQPPRRPHTFAEQAPPPSREDSEYQAALEASQLEAALAASRSSEPAHSSLEEDKQLQEVLRLSVQEARRKHSSASSSSWTRVLEDAPNGASSRGRSHPVPAQAPHTLPSRDPDLAPSAPQAPLPMGWDPFSFDSGTPAQHMPASRQPQPYTSWPQPPATQDSWQPPIYRAPVTRPLQQAEPVSTADDEALARALQASQVSLPRHPASPPPAHVSSRPAAPNTADDEALARALQASLNSQIAPQPSQPAAARLPHTHSHPQPSPHRQPAQRPDLHNSCAGCGQSLPGFWSLGQTIEAGGKRYHSGCFVCAGCSAPLGTGVFVHGQDEQLYHRPCHRARFHPKCAVCADFLPEQNGVISWVTWALQDKCCPSHSNDGTHRCCGCGRLCPRGETWAEVQPGRHICLACLDSIVVDTQDAQPLYTKVLAFFAKLGMPLPERPPLLLVDSESLGNAREKEGDCSHDQPPGTSPAPISGPVMHTRGLCLWQEHRTVRTVMRRGQGGTSFWFTMPQIVQMPESRSEITAIMVLCGLPWLLTGSIIAHEVMHAWLRLSGYPKFPPQVEEGMCQLTAMLWLEQQPAEPEGTWAERLLSLCAHSIRTDRSPVYGDGFRAALEAFQDMGLPALLTHLRQHASFPHATCKA